MEKKNNLLADKQIELSDELIEQISEIIECETCQINRLDLLDALASAGIKLERCDDDSVSVAYFQTSSNGIQ